MRPYYSTPTQQQMLTKLIADPKTLVVTDLDGTVLDGFNPTDDRGRRLGKDENPYDARMKPDIYADNAMNVYFRPNYAQLIQQEALTNYVALTGRSAEQVKEIAEQSGVPADKLPPAITTHGELLTIGDQSISVLPFTEDETQFMEKSAAFIDGLDPIAQAFLKSKGITLPNPAPELQHEKKGCAAGINARAYFALPELENDKDLQEELMSHLQEKFETFLDSDDNPSLPEQEGKRSFVVGVEPAGLEIHRGHVNKALGLKRYLAHRAEQGTLPDRVIFFGDSLFKNGKPQGTDYSAMEYIKTGLKEEYGIEGVGVYVHHPEAGKITEPNPKKSIPSEHPLHPDNSETGMDYLLPTPQVCAAIQQAGLAKRPGLSAPSTQVAV